MKYPRTFPISLFIILIIPFLLSQTTASASETYAQAVTNAQNNIDNNANFIPGNIIAGNKAIITILPGSSAFGLTYQNYGGTDYLVTRTFTKSKSFFRSSTQTLTGVGDTNIYGGATTDAAWVTTGNDATKFLDGQSATSDKVTDILERGLGMNNNASHNMIVEYAVLPNNDNIMRPSREADIASYSTISSDYAFSGNFDSITKPTGMSDTTFANLKTYLTGWQNDALGTLDSEGNPTWNGVVPDHPTWSRFPWTELGYSYFWDSGGTDLAHIQGMTELIILGGTAVKILGIYSPQSYLYTKNKGGIFSTASDAQYGNGFANFKITESCDTVWAGNAFQKKVSTSSAAGQENTITIDSGGSVSGGQGILVWSLNYKVINNGVISGSTQNKLYYDAANTGLTGTADIAVLFKGTADVIGATNQLINSGTISSPGTAVKVEAGTTTIANTGTISGTECGIDMSFASGSTDTFTLTNTGGTISGGIYSIYTANTLIDTVTISGGTVSGDIYIGKAVTDTLTVKDNATLGFVLNRDTEASSHIDSGTTKIAESTGVTLAPTIGGSQNVQDNETFLVVDAFSLTTTISNITIQNDSTHPMITFTARKSGDQLYMDAARDNSYYANNSGNASLGRTIDALANTATGDMTNLIGSLDGSGSAANAQQLEPINANGGTTQAGYQTSLQFINTVLSHFDNVASGKIAGLSGIARENAKPKEVGVWAQGFDTYMHQFATGTGKGYTANVAGFSAGYDVAFFDNFIFGFKGGLAWDTIRSRGPNTSNKVNSYEGGVYGSYGNEKYYVDGIASFAYNDYNAKRHVSIGSSNYDPWASYGGWQYSVYGETGYTFDLGKFRFTPLASLQYMRLDVDGYTEKDGGAATLKVDKQGYNLLETGLGARLSCLLPAKGFTFVPDIHFKWLYDAINDGEQATSTFTGGGAAFETSGYKPPKSSYNIGTRWVFLTKNGFTFSVNYDCQLRPDFYSNSGYGNIRYDF